MHTEALISFFSSIPKCRNKIKNIWTAFLVSAIKKLKDDGSIGFVLPAEFARYVAFKGSIGVNGVSLTVADLGEKSFSVWIIPHTFENTNLGDLVPGNRVNLEFDILAKYVERLVQTHAVA